MANRNPSGIGGFRPGVSGNPGGRRKLPQRITELAREHTEAAMQTLIAICEDPKASVSARVSAAIAILDRGWGKPIQAIEFPRHPLDALNENEQEALLKVVEASLENAPVSVAGEPH